MDNCRREVGGRGWRWRRGRPGGKYSAGRSVTSQLAPNRSIKRKSPPPAAQFFMFFHCILRLLCVCVCV